MFRTKEGAIADFHKMFGHDVPGLYYQYPRGMWGATIIDSIVGLRLVDSGDIFHKLPAKVWGVIKPDENQRQKREKDGGCLQ